jgi:murein DD-endopeptidase MepM/ murein hydrolase activator NlpD
VVAAAAVLVTAALGAAEPRQVAAAEGRMHVVVSGDTLGAIAKRYGVSVPALVSANRLANERVGLRIGQRLVVPSAPAAAIKPSKPARVTAAPPARPPAVRVSRGPQGLDLSVPDFLEVAPAFIWPVDGPVTSTFGRRRNGWHRGIDIMADLGTVIFAAAAGTVVASGTEPRYGRVIKIEHDDGYVTVYAHNEENFVKTGARVAAGDPIATIGRTGRASAHHLHFEIRRSDSVYNPLYLLPLPPRVAQVEEAEEPGEQHE